MSETPVGIPPLREEPEEARPAGRTRRLLAAVALAVLVILVFLLLWRPWSGGGSTADGGRRPGKIATVDEYQPSEAQVTVWLKPGVRIEDVLQRHGLPSEGLTSLGGGLYVISAGERRADVVIEDLKRDDALYDAGRLYEQGSETATP